MCPPRSKLAQGYPAVRSLRLGLPLACMLAAAAAAACEVLPLRALAPGLWLVPAAAAESDAGNRGHTAHVLLARDGARLWTLGSGATPVFGARLRCTAERQLGLAPTDLVVPWAQAEVTLGVRGLAPRRDWAHEQVAAAMAEQCPRCVERLRQRLGAAASDLGDDPARLPRRVFRGEAGRLGPFDWWVLTRAEARVVTVLRHRASGVTMASGLLWGDGPPDLRDADLALVEAALQRLRVLGRPHTRWVGQTGPLLDAAGVAAQAAYVRTLLAEARAAVAQGRLESEAPALPGHEHPRHALNWQRAWRQAEDAWLRRN